MEAASKDEAGGERLINTSPFLLGVIRWAYTVRGINAWVWTETLVLRFDGIMSTSEKPNCTSSTV